MNKATILADSYAAVTGRETDHGNVNTSLEATSDLVKAYLHHKFGVDLNLQPGDICMFLLFLKVGRFIVRPDNVDHYVDMAGYSACAGELFTETQDDTHSIQQHI